MENKNETCAPMFGRESVNSPQTSTFINFLTKLSSKEVEIFQLKCNLTVALLWVVIFGTFSYLIWYFFVKKVNFFWDYSDLGFDQILQQYKGKSDVVRRNIVNEHLRRKKIGAMPPPYPNGWFAILESSDLKPGEVKEVDALGLNLVAWRGQTSSKCFVSDAYCPHLGAHLGVGGKVTKDCIECPFHGWKFDGCKDGKLTEIPYVEDFSKLSNSFQSKLKMYTILERHGNIYLWYHAEGDEPTWEPDILPEVESDKTWIYRGRGEFRVTTHIQELMENIADPNHFAVVHPPLAVARYDAEPTSSFFGTKVFEHKITGKWRKGSKEEGREHTAICDIDHDMKILGMRLPLGEQSSELHQLGPGLVVGLFNISGGKAGMIITLTPVEPCLLKVVQRFYCQSKLLYPFFTLIVQSELIQVSRDIKIWNRKTIIKNPVLPKEDRQIKEFRKWYSQFYSESSDEASKNDSGISKYSF